MVKGDRNQFGLLIAVVFISGHLSSFLHAVYSRRKKEGRYFSRFEGFSYRLNAKDQRRDFRAGCILKLSGLYHLLELIHIRKILRSPGRPLVPEKGGEIGEAA